MSTITRLLPPTVLALLLLSVCVNVLQAARINTLLETRAAPLAPLGALAPVLDGVTTRGARSRVAFDDGRPAVIYYFSSGCGWCERNWPNVEALAASSGDRFRFMAVTAERDVRSFVAARGFDFEVIQAVSDDTRRAFGFRGTPHTVVVSSQGLITHEWVGAYDRHHRRQIERLFDVALPGLTP
ncbi:MAG TPA: TlpA disulfide reductase family protein [Vicinamibacterales bacterium]|nr:TlpA disulfide reductase family protein [Vicinamibacterales bacterium]